MFSRLICWTLFTWYIDSPWKGSWKSWGYPGIFHLKDTFWLWILFRVFPSILHQQTHRSPLCAKKKNIRYVIGPALKGLVLELKEALVSVCLPHSAWLKSAPPLLDKCKAFSALNTSCWPCSFSACYCGMGGQHLQEDDTTPVQHFDQGIGADFQLGSFNYSFNYVEPLECLGDQPLLNIRALPVT